MPIKDRTEPVERAYYYLYTYRDCLSIGRVNNPVSGQEETRILCEDLPTGKKVIVLKLEEKRSCIDFYNRRGKGERARKIKKQIAEAFALVSESEIQCYINNSGIKQKIKGRFDNKSKLKPVTAKQIWQRVQIDLMSMADLPISIDGKTYQWILSIFHVILY